MKSKKAADQTHTQNFFLLASQSFFQLYSVNTPVVSRIKILQNFYAWLTHSNSRHPNRAITNHSKAPTLVICATASGFKGVNKRRRNKELVVVVCRIRGKSVPISAMWWSTISSLTRKVWPPSVYQQVSAPLYQSQLLLVRIVSSLCTFNYVKLFLIGSLH